MPVVANVAFAKRIFSDRVGNEYIYGGCWNPGDTSVGTDCSGLVVHILDAVVNGAAMNWTRHGMTTESWRPIEVGQTGTIFGTVCVASPSDFPSDALVKIALHHGEGGGVNSHMWCEFDGVRAESNGSDGCVTGNRAMSVYDTGYANNWHYLPRPGSAPVTQRDRYARDIIAEGQRRSVSPRGIQIALAVALVESNMTMYANSSVPQSLAMPHDAVGRDYDSVGLFQQRCPMWGPVEILMSARQSAGLFYDRLVRLDYNNRQRSAGWYAAEVQRPAEEYRGRYDERFNEAVALYNSNIIFAQQKDEGFLMALTSEQQQQIYDEICGQRASRSPLHKPGEGTIGDIGDLESNTDGSVHILVQFLLGVILRSRDTIAELRAVAASTDPNQAGGAAIAQAMLNLITIIDNQGIGVAALPLPLDSAPRHAAPEAGGALGEDFGKLHGQLSSLTEALGELSTAFVGRK